MALTLAAEYHEADELLLKYLDINVEQQFVHFVLMLSCNYESYYQRINAKIKYFRRREF
jgi:hypothetical protein